MHMWYFLVVQPICSLSESLIHIVLLPPYALIERLYNECVFTYFMLHFK